MQTVPLALVRELIRGATDLEDVIVPGVGPAVSPVRLAAWTRVQQADRWIEFWSAHTVGVRLVMVTAARRIELDVSVTRMLPEGLSEPLFPASAVVTIDSEPVARTPIDRGPLIVNHVDRTWTLLEGPPTTLSFDLGDAGPAGADREVTVWLPHNGHAAIHALRADAPVASAPPSGLPRWVHHGSSISHSLEAVDPLGPWAHQAARALGLDLTNLAIAGNAQLDPFVARTIAAHPADVVSLKLGVNTINADSMRARTFVPALHGFLDLVREGHPGVPLLVMSPIASPALEDVPGPSHKEPDGLWYGTPRPVVAGDGTLTLRVVRDLVRRVVEDRQADDDLLWFDDGLTLFSQDDAPLLWDGLHPNQEGYDLIAQRFVDRARGATPTGEAFARVLRT